MFGSVGEWLFHSLGGIQMTSPGFKTFRIKPQLVEGLDWVKCSYESSYGMIKSEWKKEGDEFDINISVPVNTIAELYIPVSPKYRIFENDIESVDVEGVISVKNDNGCRILKLKSGDYRFKTK